MANLLRAISTNRLCSSNIIVFGKTVKIINTTGETRRPDSKLLLLVISKDAKGMKTKLRNTTRKPKASVLNAENASKKYPLPRRPYLESYVNILNLASIKNKVTTINTEPPSK